MTTHDACADANGRRKEPSADDLVRHLLGCDPCGQAMSAEKLNRVALRSLSSATNAAAPGATLVEQSVAFAAVAGRDRLRRLLCEMSRACLVEIDSSWPTRWYEEPEGISALAEKTGRQARRLGMESPQAGLPGGKPADSVAAEFALKCVDLCDEILGPSDRTAYQRGAIALRSGRLDDAETILRSLSESTTSGSWRRKALTNLVAVWLRKEQYQEAAKIGSALMEDSGAGRTISFNHAVACAGSGDRRGFLEASRRFLESDEEFDAGFWSQVVQGESQFLARSLSLDASDVLVAFGLDARGSA